MAPWKRSWRLRGQCGDYSPQTRIKNAKTLTNRTRRGEWDVLSIWFWMFSRFRPYFEGERRECLEKDKLNSDDITSVLSLIYLLDLWPASVEWLCFWCILNYYFVGWRFLKVILCSATPELKRKLEKKNRFILSSSKKGCSNANEPNSHNFRSRKNAGGANPSIC